MANYLAEDAYLDPQTAGAYAEMERRGGIAWATLSPIQKNALVAEKVLGWTDFEEPGRGSLYNVAMLALLPGDTRKRPVPCYTTSIAAAWKIIEWTVTLSFSEHRVFINALRCLIETEVGIGGDGLWLLHHCTPDRIAHAACVAIGAVEK